MAKIDVNKIKLPENYVKTVETVDWLQGAIRNYPNAIEIVDKSVRRFQPKDSLVEVVTYVLTNKYSIETKKAIEIANEAINSRINTMTEENWLLRLQYLFGGKYPEISAEVVLDGEVYTTRYRGKVDESVKPSYDLPNFSKVKLAPILCRQLVPCLHRMEPMRSGYRAVATTQVERFKNFHDKAVLKSSLHEVKLFNRPVHGVSNNWLISDESLPAKIIVPTIVIQKPSKDLIEQFKDELGKTFCFESEQQLGNYLGYVIQPMLTPYFRGQFPIYCFSGTTGGGKSYTSEVLVSHIYKPPLGSSVNKTHIPETEYEFATYLSKAKGNCYVVFDEIALASDEQIKLIDRIATSSKYNIRIMREGYAAVDNDLTIAMTAVHRGFSDETQRRIVKICFDEQADSKMVKNFDIKWKSKGPELLAALFERLACERFDIEKLPEVVGRPSGFSLLRHCIGKVFYIDSNYSIEADQNFLLDQICEAFQREFERNPDSFRKTGHWYHCTARPMINFIGKLGGEGFISERKQFVSQLRLALTVGSTKKHSVYADTGYPFDGKFYHIKYKVMKDRTEIGIQPLENPTNSTFSTEIDNSKIANDFEGSDESAVH